MNKALISRIVAIVVSAVLVIAFFLPLISATEDYREYLDELSGKPFESIDLSFDEMKDMSLFTYAKVYFQCGDEFFGSSGIGTIYGILISAVALFSLLTLLGAAINKPVVSIIFDILTVGAYYAVIWDFMSRKIMPSTNSAWGIAYNLYYPCAALILIAAILMIVWRKKRKKTVPPVVAPVETE